MPICEVIEDPVKLAEYQFALTCEKAIEGAPLSVIKKIDQEFYARMMYQLFALLSDMVNVSNKFSMSAIPVYLQAIFSRYYYLTIDEVAYVFKKGISGEYKKEYNKLDLDTLMNWFEKYDTTERMLWIDKRNHNDRIEQEKKIQENAFLLQSVVNKEKIKDIIDGIGLNYDNIIMDNKEEEKKYKKFKLLLLDESEEQKNIRETNKKIDQQFNNDRS